MSDIHTIFICNDGEYFLRHRRQVADEMAKRSMSVEVIAGGKPISETARGNWRYVHVNVERFAMNIRADWMLAVTSYREMVAQRASSVQLITLKPVVVSGLAAMMARAIGRGPRRIVMTIPGLGRLMSPRSPALGLRARASRFVVARIIRFLTRRPGVSVTFESEGDREHWVKYRLVSREASHVIGGAGVDPELFHPRSEPRKDRKIRVLFASRLLKAKGLDVFVDVARRLNRNDLEFLVAGMAETHDPDGIPAIDLAAEWAITFLGEVADMPELLREVDIVCLPTRYGEGIPRILIEAAATGLPSIASDVHGCTEIVENGVNGITIPHDNYRQMVAGLIDAVEKYYAQPEMISRHGSEGLRIFRAGQYTEEIVIRRFIELLTD